jgi:hypothetical protein
MLLDLKMGEFDHSGAGQMNMYLNYYEDNESANGDNCFFTHYLLVLNNNLAK